MSVSENPSTGVDLQTVGARLRLDGALADVFTRFEAAGVRARVLKGPAIAQWLYPQSGARTYIDCDVLLCPDDVAAAGEALVSLGFERDFDDSHMPEWWREHAGEWVRTEDGVTIDLHRTLSGITVDDARAWALLSEDAAPVTVVERELPALSLPGRALHIALHAAQHGVGQDKPMQDLKEAVRQTAADLELWRSAGELAAALGAVERFASGLRLDPAGALLADRLDLPSALSIETRLRAESALPQALTVERLASADGFITKATIIWRKLVPPASYLKKWDKDASLGGRHMVRAYVRRVRWIARSTPPALRAWQQARRSVRRSGG